MNDEFYIGYLPKAPPILARQVKRIIAALGIGALVLAAVLVIAQNPFAAATFEFGNVRSFDGTILLHPYPTLLVGRPGDANRNASFSRYLLVAPGKHGAEILVAQFNAMQVKLKGELIYRGANTMIEVVPGSISVVSRDQPQTIYAQDFGEATLTGEIVDTKCYFGVMNPGSGKVHRDCAARCISGGVPAAFVAHQGTAQTVYLLTDASGRAMDRRVTRSVAETITIHGNVIKMGETLFLATNASRLYSDSQSPKGKFFTASGGI